MATDATLDDIALGDVDPAQARAALSKAFGGSDPKVAQRVYTALRAWVWKAIDGRRRDPELREWFDVLRRAAAFLRTKDTTLADRVAVLHELVQESIAVSERLPSQEVLQRRHVREVLAMLVVAPDGRLDRAEIGRRLGLKQGNLTRVLNMVVEAGFAERTTHGKEAEFQLTRAGHEAAGRHGLRKPVPVRATAPVRHHGYGGGFVRLNVPETPVEVAVLRVVERQGMIVAGYAKAGIGVRTVQEAARRNQNGKLVVAEPTLIGAVVQGHLGNVPSASPPARKPSNAWADALHD
ncbi:MarR family transcriptional regulator [Methylorubrum aminovorans]